MAHWAMKTGGGGQACSDANLAQCGRRWQAPTVDACRSTVNFFQGTVGAWPLGYGPRVTATQSKTCGLHPIGISRVSSGRAVPLPLGLLRRGLRAAVQALRPQRRALQHEHRRVRLPPRALRRPLPVGVRAVGAGRLQPPRQLQRRAAGGRHVHVRERLLGPALREHLHALRRGPVLGPRRLPPVRGEQLPGSGHV